VEGKTYKIGMKPASWDQARMACRTQGSMDLAVVTSSSISNALYSQVSAEFGASDSLHWLGASDGKVEGSWQWVDGSAWGPYSGWASGQPSHSAEKDCLMAGASSTPVWFEHACNEALRPMCGPTGAHLQRHGSAADLPMDAGRRARDGTSLCALQHVHGMALRECSVMVLVVIEASTSDIINITTWSTRHCRWPFTQSVASICS
jgi:hypothetical protein